MDEKQKIMTVIQNENITSPSSGRDLAGRFIKGNKIATDVHITGVRSIDIRKHRAFINGYIPQLLQILIDEALINKNVQVTMWLVSKIIPDTKIATCINTNFLSEINTLGELKDQSSQTIQESLQGNLSLEAAIMLMRIYQQHKNLIEAADIEPLARELEKRI